MVSFRFKRYTLAALAMLFVLAVGLLLPPSQVAAGPGTPPPPVGPKTDLPKPSGAQNSASAQTGSQAGSDASLNGQKTERLKPTNRSTTPSAAVTTAWSVSLTSSTSTPSVNQGFTLTARANQDVGPTPYYIQIYLGSTRYASCGSGTICSVTLYSSAAGASYTFQARISAYDGSSAQAWSNTVTVRITTSWSVSLSSSSTSPTVGQSYTLTARANQDVGPTPYYIQIYLGSTRYASCGSGTTCSVTLSGSQAGASYTYQARISLYDGSNVQAWSNTVAVTVAAAARWCWCTDYVANRFNLPRNYPDAKDWGPYLTLNGYRQVTSPQIGDIVVYSGTRFPTAGHVGVIVAVGTSNLTVRGANQLSSWTTVTEVGCTNVSQGLYVRSSSGEAYYRR